MEPLADVLRRRREELRTGQAELAEQLGVSQQTVSRWESGQALPRPSRLAQLAELLHLDLERLHRAAGFLPGDEDADGATLAALRRTVVALDECQLLELIDCAWHELAARRGVRLPSH